MPARRHHDGVTQLVSAVALRTATLSRGLRRDGGASPERLASVGVSLDRMTDDLEPVTAELRTLMGDHGPSQSARSGRRTGAFRSRRTNRVIVS